MITYQHRPIICFQEPKAYDLEKKNAYDSCTGLANSCAHLIEEIYPYLALCWKDCGEAGTFECWWSCSELYSSGTIEILAYHGFFRKSNLRRDESPPVWHPSVKLVWLWHMLLRLCFCWSLDWSYLTYYMCINNSLDNNHSSVNLWQFVSFLNPLPWFNREFQSIYFKETVMLIDAAWKL